MIEPMTTNPSAVASSMGLTGNVGTMKGFPYSILRAVFADFVANANRTTVYDPGVAAAKMERCALLAVGESFGFGSVASRELRAARVLEVADLENNVRSDTDLA